MKKILGLGLAAVFLCVSPAAHADSDGQILHLLNRISFGPEPGDIDRVRSIGMGAYIEQQLHPDTIQMPPDLAQRLDQLDITDATLPDLTQRYQPDMPEGKMDADARKAFNQQLNQLTFQLAETKILRAVDDPAQLQEVMTDFWFNHFNVFQYKGLDRIFIATYERDAIRPYALGKFRDLLGAVAHSPAMLVYLDNWQNTDPGSLAGMRAAQHGHDLGINENYAREIMELHTLGVDGGYTQTDVTTLAHILTGWGLGKGKDWVDHAVFYFDPQRHDYSNHIFLGQPIRGGGEDEIEHVLDMLASSPATAHHIAYELAQEFVADNPPASLVDKMALAYETSDGDIADVMRTMFHAPEFWAPRYAQDKFKPPFRYVVSALRAMGASPQGDTRMLQGMIADMGEPLYRFLTPNGYANTNDQWLNSDALLKRVDDAQRLARFQPGLALDNVWNAIGDNGWTQKTRAAAQAADPKLRPALLLASPEFLYY